MLPSRRNSLSAVSLLLPLIIVASGSFALDFFTPAMGDDLGKWNALGLDAYTAPTRDTLKFLKAQYFECNGRLFDGIGPVIINLLPHFAGALVMALMTTAYFLLMAACSGTWRRGRVTATWLITLVTLAAMPWWDYMLLRVCQFNYLWGTVFVLLFILIYYRDVKLHAIWLLAVGFLAGSCHEQSGVAMSAVFGVIAGSRWRAGTLDRKTGILTVALFAGTMFAILSPAFWHRAENHGADADFITLLLTTLPILLLLIAMIAVMALTRPGRRTLKQLYHTEWAAYVAVAIISGLIAIYSTIPGRTGWLSESLAIVALARMVISLNIKLPRAAAVTVSLLAAGLVSAHFLVAARWQQALGREYADVVDLFKASDDGTVYYDITLDNEVPPIALGRVKGVPDADDIHLINNISRAYGPGKRLVVVPTAFSSGLPSGTDRLDHGAYTLYRTPPPTDRYTDFIVEEILVTADGRVLTPFTAPDGSHLYLASPLVVDPGDSWHKTE